MGRRQAQIDPHERIHVALTELIEQHAINLRTGAEMIEKRPKKWTRIGDAVVLSAEIKKFVDTLGTYSLQYWTSIAGALGASAIAIQGEIEGRERRPQTKIVWGEKKRQIHREGGIQYIIDLENTMFSSGNVSERLRMGNMNCNGEIVVDLFAGIGYYSIPILKHAGASHLHACEWSKDALRSLEDGVYLNEVNERCTIYPGDCRETILDAVSGADRAILGLLPSSRIGWDIALGCLKSAGGLLHIHEVIDLPLGKGGKGARKSIEKSGLSIIEELSTLDFEHNVHRSFKIQHIESVKSYGPHRRHVVFDILVK